MWFIARDHDDARLEEHVELVRQLATEIVGPEPRASFTLDGRGAVPEHAERCSTGTPRSSRSPRRRSAAQASSRCTPSFAGGTDGARLTEKGLPTPNLFTGGQHYHSLREWASLQDMAAAAATCVELVKLWGERPKTG